VLAECFWLEGREVVDLSPPALRKFRGVAGSCVYFIQLQARKSVNLAGKKSRPTNSQFPFHGAFACGQQKQVSRRHLLLIIILNYFFYILFKVLLLSLYVLCNLNIFYIFYIDQRTNFYRISSLI
jgi:hypothetical protein